MCWWLCASLTVLLLPSCTSKQRLPWAEAQRPLSVLSMDKKFQVSQRLCIAMACTTKSLVTHTSHTGDADGSLQLCDTPFISPPKGWLLERQWKQCHSPSAASLSSLWGAGAEGMAPLQVAIFSSCILGWQILQLFQMSFTACPSTHY